jgi:hypothetical protein
LIAEFKKQEENQDIRLSPIKQKLEQLILKGDFNGGIQSDELTDSKKLVYYIA